MLSQNNTLFEEGNSLYNDGQYYEAIERYNKIIASGEHSAELYFNIANAHYKLNHIAPSIYNYEKALLLAPNDKDISNNIAFARNMTIDAIDVVPEVGFSKLIKTASSTLSFDGWAKLSIALMTAFVLLFIVYYFSYITSRKRLAFVGSIVALIFTVVALFFAFHKYSLDQNNNPAIVFAVESQIKSEPNLRSEIAFQLHEGTKVQIIDTVDDWNEIQLSDGKTGWIASEDIRLLKNF